MSFASLLESYDGEDAAPPAPAPQRARPPRTAWSQLNRGDRRLREALERGAKRALREAEEACGRGDGKRRLAVCFTVVDGLPHEAVWRVGGSVRRRASTSPLLARAPARARRVALGEGAADQGALRDTVGLRGALPRLCLLGGARGDPAAVAASETCVPVCGPDRVADLVDAPASRMVCTGRPNNGYALQVQWAKVHRSVDAAHVWKADQWVVLSRLHAEAAARLDGCARREARHRDDAEPLWRLLRKCTAPDELLFPVSLALCGNGKSPKTFAALDAAVVAAANVDGCLFARKFKDPVPVDAWRALVLGDEDGDGDDAPPKKRRREEGGSDG
ncbi:hypothetical protein JL720_5587 [Aureococcus anophagefferens]|nr:hypothetical protein JL720_5587 [Aureococcus anophagefferens]